MTPTPPDLKRSARHTLLALLLAVGGVGGLAHADAVTLRAESFVKGPTILLGDIAEIEGERADLLAAIEVGPAAQPATAKRFNMAMLGARLKTAGIDPATVDLKGAANVSVTTLSAEVSRAALVDSLRAYILATMPWQAEDADIDIPQPFDDLVVPDGTVEINWRANPQYRYVGAGGFRGDVLVDGKLERSVMLRANVNAYAEVLIARAEIPRGTVARAESFEKRKELLTGAAQDRIADAGLVQGQIAKKTIFPGQPVRSGDFEAPKVIKRSQLVNVETRAGGLVIQSQAVAMNDARVGDMLLCSNPGSKQEFQGLVRVDGTVVVP